jgi:hypothetical protein
MTRAFDRATHSAALDRADADDLRAVRRQEWQRHDAKDLATVALLKWPGDRLAALGWVAFVWRSQPDAYEVDVQRFAVEMLRDGLSESERETWDRVAANRETLDGTEMGLMVDAVTAKHERHQEPLHMGAADPETIERLRAA